MSTRKNIFIYGLILLYAFAPLLSVLVCGMIASLAGCNVSEAGASPCPILGFDMGGVLVTMLVCGWLMFWTLPSGLLFLVIFTIIVLILRQRRKARVAKA
jgi:TRAP-type C4-dicarboxylate transport system permease small subunit